MNTAEVSEVLATYPDVLRDTTLEIIGLGYDLDNLQVKKVQLEKNLMINLYQEFPLQDGLDPLQQRREQVYFKTLDKDIMYQALRRDIDNIRNRLSSLEVSKEFYSNKLRATIALVNIEVTRDGTLQ